MTAADNYSQQIKDQALLLGFSACGIARVAPIHEEQSYFMEWLKRGYNGDMHYLENNTALRFDPSLLVNNVRSVIMVALNYYPLQKQHISIPQIAYYAYGEDYHAVVKQKLKALLGYINEQITSVSGRYFCDSAPVLERYWACKAGLGWIGKNGLLLLPRKGSYFFLGSLFVDIELSPDIPLTNRCGTCHRCIDACPTKALRAPYIMDARKCLSYLTIEYRGELPENFASFAGNKIYGCDECQKVCPWNRFATPCDEERLQPTHAFLSLNREKMLNMTEKEFDLLFKRSAVKRCKFTGWQRNVKAVIDCSKEKNDKKEILI